MRCESPASRPEKTSAVTQAAMETRSAMYRVDMAFPPCWEISAVSLKSSLGPLFFQVFERPSQRGRRVVGRFGLDREPAREAPLLERPESRPVVEGQRTGLGPLCTVGKVNVAGVLAIFRKSRP